MESVRTVVFISSVVSGDSLSAEIEASRDEFSTIPGRGIPVIITATAGVASGARIGILAFLLGKGGIKKTKKGQRS
jgi:hypothetical protein